MCVLHQRSHFPSLVWWCVGAFRGQLMNQFLPGLVFSSCTLNNTKGFHGRMFSSSASSAWSVDYMGWKWWYCLWACCSTASDSFGGTGDDCFTIRGTYWSAERGFLYPVIKIFTKGKQKGQIRGKQLLVWNSRTEWLVFALLGPLFPQVLSFDSPYGLLVLQCCIVQLAT